MSDQNLVAVYDTAAHADAAIQDLKAANVPASSISRHAKDGGAVAKADAPEPGFWASLFGGGESTVYDRSVEGGSIVVTVKSPEQDVTRISDILEAHDPIDLDERDAAYTATTTTTAGAPTPAASKPAAPMPPAAPRPAAETDGAGAIQLSEEQLTVGKRAVRGGTTRVHTYVVEKDVQEQVTLRDETVHVERHAVDDGRKATAADFQDRTIEMQEAHEEAVVGKTARVVEEISLRKEGSDRVETVKDTVRREDVKIEELGTDTAQAAGGAALKDAMPPKR